MPTESKRHPTRHDAYRPGWSDDRPRRKQDRPRGRGRPGPYRKQQAPGTPEDLTRTMARVYVPALVQAGAEVADREAVARLAYSRSVTHPDVLAVAAGIVAAEAEPAKREGAAIGWSDVTGTDDLPITSAPVSHRPGRSSRRPDHFIPSLGRRVHGYV